MSATSNKRTLEEDDDNYLSSIGTPSPVKKIRSLPRSFHPVVSSTAISPGPASPGAPPLNDGRMRVYVRVRPVNQREASGNNRIVVEPVDENLVVFDPVDEEPQFYYKGKTYKEPGRKTSKNIQFTFDRVFDDESTNVEVYESVTKSLITAFLDGYNCAVFAYGATGSGKTHTMLGSPEDPGVIFFTTMELFRVIENRSQEEQLDLSISYFEIYNENVYDLLSPMVGKHLAVREDPKRGVVVANLSVHQPKDAQHLLDMLEFGNRNRTQHPTDANAESSRSHAVFQVFLKKQDYSSSQEMSIQLSKMSLIDLAGSERASVAYRENRIKSVQREGSNINKSLLALGNCINALANQGPKGRHGGKKKPTHIPYRNSKLTLLLRDSLGGNCHTAMIATVSPSVLSYDDTHNTLTYANRAKGIQLNLKKNNVSVGLQPRNYNAALETMSRKNQELMEENSYLKSELNRLRSQVPDSIPKNPISSSGTALEVLNEYKNQLELLFNERLKLRREFMEAESGLKKQDLKIIFKKFEAERLQAITSANYGNNPYNDSSLMVPSRGDPDKKDFEDRNNFASLHSKKLYFIDAKKSAEERLLENQSVIDSIENVIRAKVGVTINDWLIDTYFKDKNLLTEIKDRAFAEKHSIDVAKWLIERLETNEDLILESVSLNKHIHMMLSGMNRLTDELDEKLSSLQKRVEGKKSVVWRDNPNERIFKSVGKNEIEGVFNLSVFYGGVVTPAPSRKSRQLTSICSGLTPSSFTSMGGSSTITKGKAPLRERIMMDQNLHFS